MRRAGTRAAAWVCAFVSAGLVPAAAAGLEVAPIVVTPPSLRPAPQGAALSIEIPEAGSISAPAGSETMDVTLGVVSVEGAFPDVEAQVRAIVARLEGRRVSLARIYAAAAEIEQAHARAGYVLARVVVPPQKLVAGGPLRIRVIDGSIESIDVSGIPARVRAVVLDRVAQLVGRNHLRLSDIEQPLLLAGQTAGLMMTSTLARGAEPGGVKLILAGQSRLVTGSIGGDNGLPSSLGTSSVNAQIAINSALGFGEQIYVQVSSGADPARTIGALDPVEVAGAGLVLATGDGRLTVNPEATYARTQPSPTVGMPQSVGTLRRLTLRADEVLERTREVGLDLTGVIEQIDETDAYQGYQAISHDRYMAARGGFRARVTGFDGASLGGTLQVSHGLGELGALTQADLPAGTTFSRQGAGLNFTKLEASLNALEPLAGGVQWTMVAKGQSSFNSAMFRAEQASLEGADAVSGVVGGVTAADSTLSLRSELARVFAFGGGAQIVPYVFAADGAGWIARPTVVEQSEIHAASYGLGWRLTIHDIGIHLELARNLVDIPGVQDGGRFYFGATLPF